MREIYSFIFIVILAALGLSACAEVEESPPPPVIPAADTPVVESPDYTPGVLDEDLYVFLTAELRLAREQFPNDEERLAEVYAYFEVTGEEVRAFEDELRELDRYVALQGAAGERLRVLRRRREIEYEVPQPDPGTVREVDAAEPPIRG